MDAPTPIAAPYRLPRTVVPSAYRLELAPDLVAAAFSGTVEIDVEVAEPTSTVTLHAAELDVTAASVAAGGATADAAVAADPQEEQLTLALPRALPAGPATLRLAFTGVLNDKLAGFYRSTFTDASGTEHVIATTQMEATDARRAFPCFDEPDLKATFDVTLVVPEHLAAFANGPVVADSPGDAPGTRRVTFATTMPMSTYLVAFVVGPFEATDAVDVDGVPLRVVHPVGKGHLCDFALEVGAHALRFFTAYFGIPYPEAKLDLVAIPDFAFGAMENVGCVTFRETALLADPASASRVELERIADVVSHEIAHMWFGDLVTMKWWNGIWLNEAFATFMEVLAVDAFRPEWQRWVSFGVEREAALAVDGLHATRPVEYPVGRPEEAQGMFDVLTYQKGGSVLRMLEQFIGPDAFRNGIRRYLDAHRYANTETADLWDALEAASGQPVRAVMDSWILQGGNPLVAVAEDGTVTQRPFSYRAEPGGAIGEAWRIPLFERDASSPGSEPVAALLAPGEVRTLAPGRIANGGGHGYYRVAYAEGRLTELARGIARLHPLERFTVVSDTWAAALAGSGSLPGFLGLAGALGTSGEEDPSVWTIVLGALGMFDRIVPGSDRGALERFTGALVGPLLGRLGWDPRADDGERTPSLRSAAIRTLGTLGADAAVRAEARARYDSGGLHPDTAGAVLEVVATTGTAGDFDAYLAAYRSAATPQEEMRSLYAMAAFSEAGLAERLFELARTALRAQDAPYVIQSMLANREHGPATWGRVTAHWDELAERFPANSLPRMLDGARALCGDPALAASVREFLVAHPVPGGGNAIPQILERLEVNVAFAAREAAGLGALLGSAAASLAD